MSRRRPPTADRATCTAAGPFRADTDRDVGHHHHRRGAAFPPSKFPATRTFATAAAVHPASAAAAAALRTPAAGPGTTNEVAEDRGSNRNRRPCPILVWTFALWVETNPDTRRAAVATAEGPPCGPVTSPVVAVTEAYLADTAPAEALLASDVAVVVVVAVRDSRTAVMVVVVLRSSPLLLLRRRPTCAAVAVLRLRTAGVDSAAVAEASAVGLAQVHRPALAVYYLLYPPEPETSQPWLDGGRLQQVAIPFFVLINLLYSIFFCGALKSTVSSNAQQENVRER